MICSKWKTRNSQRGFMLAMLMAFITATGILLTKAMPSVIAEVQRDNEEELIFRGEAIRNAIRKYKAKTGAYPVNLDDLVKVKPRILRRMYKDPMTQEGDWDLVTAVQPGASGDLTGLPIVGVRSKSMKDSFKIYYGKTLYNDWVFSAADDLLGISSELKSLAPGMLPNVPPGAVPNSNPTPNPGPKAPSSN